MSQDDRHDLQDIFLFASTSRQKKKFLSTEKKTKIVLVEPPLQTDRWQRHGPWFWGTVLLRCTAAKVYVCVWVGCGLSSLSTEKFYHQTSIVFHTFFSRQRKLRFHSLHIKLKRKAVINDWRKHKISQNEGSFFRVFSEKWFFFENLISVDSY